MSSFTSLNLRQPGQPEPKPELPRRASAWTSVWAWWLAAIAVFIIGVVVWAGRAGLL